MSLSPSLRLLNRHTVTNPRGSRATCTFLGVTPHPAVTPKNQQETRMALGFVTL
jgi:hypothetical protein